MTAATPSCPASGTLAALLVPATALALFVALLAVTIDAVGRHWWVPAAAAALAIAVELALVVLSRRVASSDEVVLTEPRALAALPAVPAAGPAAPTASADPPAPVAPAAPPAAPVAEGSTAPQVMWVPKSSHRPDQHEDAWAINPTGRIAAVADGASSAFMSREWAGIVAEAFAAGPPTPGLTALGDWVGALSRTWEERAGDAASTTAWWAAESQRRGSAATLIGVVVDAPDPADPAAGGRWRCWAVGDSCAAQIRLVGARWERVRSFPVGVPEAFDSHPDLLATTSPGDHAGAVPHVAWMESAWLPGDQVVLMTDAVAEWALRRERAGADVWGLLMRTGADWADLVAGERAAGAMVDDDATVVRLPCR